VRQALSYSGREYGKIIFIVHRGENEGVGERERTWLQEMYSQHDLVVFLLPARVLARCIGKQRSFRRPDYPEKQLEKRLDTHLRSWVNVRSATRMTKALLP
jgi:hypothetical protein